MRIYRYRRSYPIFVSGLMLALLLIFGCSGGEETDLGPSLSYNELIAIEMGADTASSATILVPDLMAQHPSSSEYWRVLSLDNFIKNIRASEQEEKVRYLHDLGWIEGYIIDREHDDVLLFGSESSSWPGLYADELILTIEKVNEESQDPYCSLDPIPEYVKAYNKASAKGSSSYGSSMEGMESYAKHMQQLWGPQEVVLGGVPEDSHHSIVMLEADYHMKKMSLGYVSVPPIISMLDLNKSEDSKRGGGSQSARFWFNLREGHPTFFYDDDIAMIEQCDVIVSTEAQGSTASGELFDSGEKNPDAEYWAGMLSTHFQEVAVQVEVYAQLENLYRLLAIFKALKNRGYFSEITDLANALFEECSYRRVYNIPETYPGLTNYLIEQDENQISFNLVSGGVSMTTSVGNKQMKMDSEMGRNKEWIIESRPLDGASSWTVPKRKRGKKAPSASERPELHTKDVLTPPDWSLPLK